ncbi:MAG: hypothetical protein HY698_17925, partial [Deltaproteobacteria bacterium]|nr:hypothetical protein [Deltaproteobacteria bacterium]
LFEPTGRFPMATEFHVEVPSGTKSELGGVLAAAERWSFSTPPPTVKEFFPSSGPARRDPLLFVSFDQKIDPAAVLATIRLVAGASSPSLRMATPEEIRADEKVRVLVDEAEEGRWLAFRAQGLLPADASVKVVIGPHTPSAEGPRKTAKPQEFSFRTYGPLRVKRHQCGWGGKCPPLTPWVIEFENPIDAKKFEPAMVRVDPELPGLETAVHGSTLSISGVTKGRTIYRVTLAPTLPDVFGQVLERPETVSFRVDSAPKSLSSQAGSLAVLDPASGGKFSVYSVNHEALKVKLYSVSPEQWQDYVRFLKDLYEQDKPRVPPGRSIASTTVKVKGQADELTETRIDLSPALTDGVGQVLVLIEPSVQPANRWERQFITSWLQVTHVGLTGFVDSTELLAWASSLETGAPMEGVDVALFPQGSKGRTDATGVARLPLGTSSNILMARHGNDVAFLPASKSPWGGDSWQKIEEKDELRFLVVDDRKMYRPGEQVRVKGWIRRIGGGETGDLGLAGSMVKGVGYSLLDSQGNDVTKGDITLSSLGGFDIALKLPPTMNLGPATLVLQADQEARFHHQFQVQEFRRPEFEVKATASAGPHFVGDHATVTVAATYYAGGGLPNAEVTWQVSAAPGTFTPPGRDDFSFGEWRPLWAWARGGIDEDVAEPSHHRDGSEIETYEARTDSKGAHVLRIDFRAVNPPQPMNVFAEASVMDVNRQAWTAGSNILVHPANLYVGLKSDRAFVEQGEPLRVDTIAVDLDGKAVPGRGITVRAVRLKWVQVEGEWKQVEVDPGECNVTSSEKPATCTFSPKEGGEHRITALVTDDEGRRNRTVMNRWVAGGKLPPVRELTQEDVNLIPDKKEYRPGETAEILVVAPFSPAEGVLTLRRSGILSSERFSMTGTSQSLKVKVLEEHVPGLHVQVDLVGQAPRMTDAGEPDPKLPPRPALAMGSVMLSVPPYTRTLALKVTPAQASLEPGGQTTIQVELRDAAGRPVSGGEVALAVVDEAILSLTGYRWPDPLAVFYSDRPPGARDYHMREDVVLANPEDLARATEGPGGIRRKSVGTGRMEMLQRAGAGTGYGIGGGVAAPAAMEEAADKAGAPGEQPQPIALRADLSPLALFVPAVTTDGNGRAQVPVKLPDSLTRYRVMAIAVHGGKQLGSGESTITARLPLMVRASPPRFLNFGDKFELPVVLQNQTDGPLEVRVAARSSNATLTAGSGRKVLVPANNRALVRFPAAAQKPGTARFQIAAVSGPWADASEHQLPVWTPATTEAFATYGTIDEGSMAQPIKPPSGVVPSFGGLEVTVSSTALQALTDAVLYLVSYPFECAEQLSSRIMAVGALRDVLTAFQAKGLPSSSDMIATVKRDIERLRLMQNDDGGFGFWQRGDESWAYVSVHVMHALSRAKEKGFDVPEDMLSRGREYLREVESHIPQFYGQDVRRAIVAYALSVRARLGDRDAPRARKLLNEAGLSHLPLEAVGWILSVLSGDRESAREVEEIRRHLQNRVTETAGAAHFATSYSDGAHLLLHSDRRTDGVILEALILDQPKSDLIPKLAFGLLGHRKAGHWGNTQENAFVLLALDQYFQVYEKVTPDFMARAWLGDTYAGGHAFKGRSTLRHHLDIPMHVLLNQAGSLSLILSKEGAGRLYYRIGMQYAPSDLRLPPADHGFTVERLYESVDRKDDVRREPDGAWRIKAGARVRVRLTMVAQARRYHAALVDPLPAGLEPMNPAVAVTGSIPSDPRDPKAQGAYWWWWGPWYEHQNMRDERVEAFASLLWEGVYSYSYVARATTPGVFVVPPAKAEEMYHPETFGRSQGDRVIVE